MRDKAIFSARKKMYDLLASKLPLDRLSSILDVGATADKEYQSSNFFEKLYPYPGRITALSDQDASWMSEMGVRFVKGDALKAPFKNNSFDLVFSSAVMEHVGNIENQKQFLKECIRISKKFIFITTPNKFYPIELHTALPILHWLPPNIYKKILRGIGGDYFSLTSTLNLLSKGDVQKMLYDIGQANFQINHIRFMGFKSNLLIMITK